MLASAFYTKIATACKNCGNSVKMQPSVIMAQLGNETGYKIGSHLNLTNIKYYAPGSSFQNGVYYKGNDVIKGGKDIAYESYATIEQWGKAYVHTLNLSYYKKCHGLPTYIDTCHALGNSPFAESGYRYGTVNNWHGTRGQVLIDMIDKAHLTKYDVGYSPTGNKTAVNNNNTNAVKDAQKKANEKIANDKILAQRKADEVAKQNAIKADEVLKKAKLTKDNEAIKKAQANVDKQKIIPKQKADITPNTKKTVLKSGFGFLGLLAIIIVFYNGYDL
jgi:hypothetical protein